MIGPWWNDGTSPVLLPGFGGPDYEELVRNDEELRGWIADGDIPRLRNDPLASYFLERERIKMRVFKDHLPAADIDALVAYVHWLAEGQWQKAPLTD